MTNKEIRNSQALSFITNPTYRIVSHSCSSSDFQLSVCREETKQRGLSNALAGFTLAFFFPVVFLAQGICVGSETRGRIKN